jgi:hypothetical protein
MLSQQEYLKNKISDKKTKSTTFFRYSPILQTY